MHTQLHYLWEHKQQRCSYCTILQDNSQYLDYRATSHSVSTSQTDYSQQVFCVMTLRVQEQLHRLVPKTFLLPCKHTVTILRRGRPGNEANSSCSPYREIRGGKYLGPPLPIIDPSCLRMARLFLPNRTIMAAEYLVVVAALIVFLLWCLHRKR